MSPFTARLYPPQKSAMQAGHLSKKAWILSFEDDAHTLSSDPIMQWSIRNKPGQMSLSFQTKEQVFSYCDRHHINFLLMDDQGTQHPPTPKAYADNFTKGFRW